MLIDLITKQNKAFSANLAPNDSIEALLANLKRKGEISTAVLLLEGEDPPTILFVFQNAMYAAYRLQGTAFKAMSFSGYFEKMGKAYGVLHLYLVSPVLFKGLLVLAQTQPSVVASSDMVDNARMLDNIAREKKEAVLALKGESRIHLFYFKGGTLCDNYLDAVEAKQEHPDLRKGFLELTDANQSPPIDIALYDRMNIAAADDVEEGEERIASITPCDYDLWTHADNRTGAPDAETSNGAWALEFLNGEQTGAIIALRQKRVSIGRGMGDIRINDPQVSRHHADLEPSEEALTITDQKSTNGLFVNEEKVTRKKVSVNDTIRLGDTTFRVVRRV